MPTRLLQPLSLHATSSLNHIFLVKVTQTKNKLIWRARSGWEDDLQSNADFTKYKVAFLFFALRMSWGGPVTSCPRQPPNTPRAGLRAMGGDALTICIFPFSSLMDCTQSFCREKEPKYHITYPSVLSCHNSATVAVRWSGTTCNFQTVVKLATWPESHALDCIGSCHTYSTIHSHELLRPRLYTIQWSEWTMVFSYRWLTVTRISWSQLHLHIIL